MIALSSKALALWACLNGNCYIVDYNLTPSDCARSMRLGVLTIQTERGRIPADGYRLSCRPLGQVETRGN